MTDVVCGKCGRHFTSWEEVRAHQGHCKGDEDSHGSDSTNYDSEPPKRPGDNSEKFKDFYAILGIDFNATSDEIKEAHRYKNWLLHKDRMAGAPEQAIKRAEEELKAVNEAYDTLKDPQKRRIYDEQWRKAKGARVSENPKPVAEPQIIKFTNVKPQEVQRGSFVIRNLGGTFQKTNIIIDPNSWVKITRWFPLSDSKELPLQVEIEAVGDDYNQNYVEYIIVNLDDVNTYVRIELQTRSLPPPPPPPPPKHSRRKWALTLIGLITVIFILARLWPNPRYSLLILANPQGGGSISLDPNSGSYDPDTKVILSATPAPGYLFESWSGDASGTMPSAVITMDRNKSVFAEFRPLPTPTPNPPPTSPKTDVAKSPNLTIEYEYYTTGDDAWSDSFNYLVTAQTFTPSNSHYLEYVELKLFRTGNPGQITVNILPTNGEGKPTGVPIVTSTCDGNSLVTDSKGDWKIIQMTQSPKLEAGKKYAIVVSAPSGVDKKNMVGWRVDTVNSGYSDGCEWISGDNGANWGLFDQRDLMFQEWGKPIN